VIHSIELGEALITVWRGQPSQKDVDDSLVAAKRMRARVGKPLVLVSVMAPDTRMPADDVRKSMDANWPKLVEVASTIQYVIMPRGSSALDHLISSRLFSLCVGVYALAKVGKPISVHRSLDTALTEIADLAPSLPLAEIRRLVTAALKAPT